MKKTFYLIICAALLLASCKNTGIAENKNNYAIIPAPVSLVELSGQFTFNEKSKIIMSELNSDTRLSADFLVMLIKNPTGLSVPVTEGARAKSGSVFMSIDSTVTNKEGYDIVCHS